MKSVLGRIITLVFMVLGELALGVLLFKSPYLHMKDKIFNYSLVV